MSIELEMGLSLIKSAPSCSKLKGCDLPKLKCYNAPTFDHCHVTA